MGQLKGSKLKARSEELSQLFSALLFFLFLSLSLAVSGLQFTGEARH
jgi:hypothetical protein